MSGGSVVVAVPSWNGRERTLACLDSLARVSRPALEVIVVDNASVDGSAAAVRAAHPSVRVVEMSENRGFTGAANAGLEEARRRGALHCLLLNNDAVVAEDAVELLVAGLDADPRAAAAGPTILYLDGPEIVWSAGGDIDWRRGRATLLLRNRFLRAPDVRRPRGRVWDRVGWLRLTPELRRVHPPRDLWRRGDRERLRLHSPSLQ